MNHSRKEATAGEVPCLTCGYDLRKASLDAQCPECGAAARESIDKRRAKALATRYADMSMVIGSLSVFFVPILAPLAIRFGWNALRTARRAGIKKGIRRRAYCGIIFGCLSVVTLWLYFDLIILMLDLR